MKEIIIYKSATGFAMKYATMIGEKLNVEVITYKEALKKDLNVYGRIIYVESVFGGMLLNYSNIRKNYNGEIVTLAVGYTEDLNMDYANTIKTNTNIEGKVFYARGGVDLKKLKLIPRLIFKKVTKVNESASFIDEKNVEGIISYIRGE